MAAQLEEAKARFLELKSIHVHTQEVSGPPEKVTHCGGSGVGRHPTPQEQVKEVAGPL